MENAYEIQCPEGRLLVAAIDPSHDHRLRCDLMVVSKPDTNDSSHEVKLFCLDCKLKVILKDSMDGIRVVDFLNNKEVVQTNSFQKS